MRGPYLGVFALVAACSGSSTEQPPASKGDRARTGPNGLAASGAPPRMSSNGSGSSVGTTTETTARETSSVTASSLASSTQIQSSPTGSSSTSSSTSSSSSSTSSSSSSSSSSGSTGGPVAGRESWAWLYVNFPASLAAISANAASFTHISPTFYTVNYAYTAGVAYYSNCGGGTTCSDPGTNNFDGLTTQQVAAQINALGMAAIPAIYGGAANSGVDIGVQNILNDVGGAQQSFIASMVTEAVANHYGGYNLDWEVGSGVDAAYAPKFVRFINAFKAALAPYQMSLSADAIVSNLNGTWCSGNNGYFDLGLLAGSAIDRVIIEAYTGSFGAPAPSCQSAVLSSQSPIDCPLNSSGSDVTFTGLMNFMCSNLPPGMVVMGTESLSSQTNAFAGQAVAAMQAYGMTRIAVWPQLEGSQPFLSSEGLVAPQADWYALLGAFLAEG
jgi:hypothetical protein